MIELKKMESGHNVVNIEEAKHCKRKVLRPGRTFFSEAGQQPDILEKPGLIPEDVFVVAIGSYLIGVISGLILAW